MTHDEMMENLCKKFLVVPNRLGAGLGHGHRWTNDELKVLANAWQSSVPAEIIGKHLLVSAYAVRKMAFKLRQNGIPLTYHRKGHVAGRRNMLWSQSEVEYLIKRRKDKATAEEIATELNRTFMGVQGMIAKLKSEKVHVGMLGCGKRRLWNADVLRMDVSDVYSVN